MQNPTQTSRRVSTWSKALLFTVACIPAGILIYRAYQQSLGVNPIEELTHETGLWTLRFLFITLCISPLSRLLHRPQWLAYRRMLGLFAFFYACSHFCIYIVLDQWFDLSSIVKDIIKRPYITVGMLAFVGLIPLAITSTNRWRVRLQHRWNQLHKLVYAIAILGVLHFWWLVKADVREPLWYAGILVILIAYRVYTRLDFLWQSRVSSG